MSLLAKTTHLALSKFPPKINNILRSILPLSVKRKLGKSVMQNVVHNNQTVASHDGRIFKVIEDRLFLRVFFEKNYEALLSAIAIGLIKEGDNIVDVGANFGWYSTLFSKYSRSGKIISYEPAPHSYQILNENIALNKMESNITVREVGVGQEEGFFFMEPGSESESGLAHVVSEQMTTTIEIPVVTLDKDLSNLIGEIAYMKFDIEGFEYFALKGATAVLSVENQPIIQIELNEEALQRTGSSRIKIIELLKGLGYSFYEPVPDSSGKLKKSDTHSCSDMFCFGSGVYSKRLSALLAFDPN